MSEDDSNEDDIFASVGNGSKKHSPRIPYLNLGGDELPPQMLIDETIEFLKALKYSNSELKQARRGTSLSINN